MDKTYEGNKVMGHNQVMIYDFETNETTSPYKVAFAMNDVKTIERGESALYPNGDVFVDEANYGRLLRVTPGGEIVWQYVNRAKDGRINYVHWSRIIQAEYQDKFTSFLNELNCEAQQ